MHLALHRIIKSIELLRSIYLQMALVMQGKASFPPLEDRTIKKEKPSGGRLSLGLRGRLMMNDLTCFHITC